MSDLVTDTHALIWYLEDSPNLGTAANQAFEQCDRVPDMPDRIIAATAKFNGFSFD